MDAESMTRDSKTKIINLNGNVQIIYKEHHLTCENAVVEQLKKTFDCKGNVHLIGQRSKITGDRAVMNYETNKGIIYNGTVQMYLFVCIYLCVYVSLCVCTSVCVCVCGLKRLGSSVCLFVPLTTLAGYKRRPSQDSNVL